MVDTGTMHADFDLDDTQVIITTWTSMVLRLNEVY